MPRWLPLLGGESFQSDARHERSSRPPRLALPSTHRRRHRASTTSSPPSLAGVSALVRTVAGTENTAAACRSWGSRGRCSRPEHANRRCARLQARRRLAGWVWERRRSSPPPQRDDLVLVSGDQCIDMVGAALQCIALLDRIVVALVDADYPGSAPAAMVENRFSHLKPHAKPL